METTGTRRYPGEVVYAYNTDIGRQKEKDREVKTPKLYNKFETSLGYK